MARHNNTDGENLSEAFEADMEDLSRNSTLSTDRYVGKRRKVNRRRILRNVLIGILLMVLAAGGAAAGYIHYINGQLSSGLDKNLDDVLVPTEAGKPFYMLLLGIDKDEDRTESSDYGTDSGAYRSDSIMLARIDPQDKKVTLVSIHRDTLVNLDSHGQRKINDAFSIGGAGYATKVIAQFAGVDISHYAEVDMDSMAKVVDAVGGITVNLPVPVKDPEYTGLDLPAGEQTINGTTAALLSRARPAYDNYGDGDLYRAANQRSVIIAVIKKLMASDAATMVKTVTAMAEMVNTDMDAGSIAALATQFRDMNVNEDIMTGMEPTTSEYRNDTWYEICNTKAWQAMMQRVGQGLPPYAKDSDDPSRNVSATGSDNQSSNATEGNASSTANKPKPGEGSYGNDAPSYTGSVQVLNASTTDGAARRVSEELQAKGFTTTASSATATSGTTRIIYNGDASMASARGVAETLGGDVKIEANNGSHSTNVNVVVILGTDKY